MYEVEALGIVTGRVKNLNIIREIRLFKLKEWRHAG